MKLDDHGLPDESELTPEFLQEAMDVINVVNRFSQKYKCDMHVTCNTALKPYIAIDGNTDIDESKHKTGFWKLYIRNDGSITKNFIH